MMTVGQTCPCWGGGSGMGAWGMGGSGLWGLGVLWPLLWLLVIAVLVIGTVYLFRNGVGRAGSDRALDLLRDRYARGEISDEEFEERSPRLSSR